jgi:hypothetical protein
MQFIYILLSDATRHRLSGDVDQEGMSGNTLAAAILSRDLIVADIVARTGIDEPMIERLVRTFCGRARLDPLIGPSSRTGCMIGRATSLACVPSGRPSR